MKKYLTLVVLLIILPLATSAREFPAKVVRVVDADTIVVDIDLGFGVELNTQRIRLARINAPELNTEAGKKVKAHVVGLLAGKEIVLEADNKRDRYGRIIAEVILGGKNVSDALLSEGRVEAYKGAK